MEYKLFNADNTTFDFEEESADVVYCDMIYESENLNWIENSWYALKTGGVFIVQTDWHTLAKVWTDIDYYQEDAVFLNHLVWKNEWGNHPKDRFHQCFDDILIFSKGKKHKFYSDRIQVAKKTAKTNLNPSGRETKTATAFIDDICLTTTANERVKTSDGHLIRWQKPLKLFDRIVLPFVDDGDLIIDPFMGSGSLGVWCIQSDYNLNYIGVEIDPEVFDIASKRIKDEYDTKNLYESWGEDQ